MNKYELIVVTHRHSYGATTYTAVVSNGTPFDLEQFIKDNEIDFEEHKGETINWDYVGTPDGFVIAEASRIEQADRLEQALSDLLNAINVDSPDGFFLCEEAKPLIEEANLALCSREELDDVNQVLRDTE